MGIRKKIISIIIIGVLFCTAAISGYFYKKSNAVKELPVHKSTTSYPALILQHVTDIAS